MEEKRGFIRDGGVSIVKKLIAFLFCIILLAQVTIPPALSMDDKEREILMEHVEKLKQLSEFTSKPIGVVLEDKEFDEFFERYAQALTVIQVADKVANANDREAVKLIVEELSDKLTDKLFEKFAPDLLTGAFGFVKWAKTGMELFKDFVFDPWISQQIEETYAARRSEHPDPADAYAALFGLGELHTRAEKLLVEKGYNPKQIGKKMFDDMVDQFLNAELEAQYQRKLLMQAAKKARSEAAADDQQFIEFLRQKTGQLNCMSTDQAKARLSPLQQQASGINNQLNMIQTAGLQASKVENGLQELINGLESLRNQMSDPNGSFGKARQSRQRIEEERSNLNRAGAEVINLRKTVGALEEVTCRLVDQYVKVADRRKKANLAHNAKQFAGKVKDTMKKADAEAEKAKSSYNAILEQSNLLSTAGAPIKAEGEIMARLTSVANDLGKQLDAVNGLSGLQQRAQEAAGSASALDSLQANVDKIVQDVEKQLKACSVENVDPQVIQDAEALSATVHDADRKANDMLSDLSEIVARTSDEFGKIQSLTKAISDDLKSASSEKSVDISDLKATLDSIEVFHQAARESARKAEDCVSRIAPPGIANRQARTGEVWVCSSGKSDYQYGGRWPLSVSANTITAPEVNTYGRYGEPVRYPAATITFTPPQRYVRGQKIELGLSVSTEEKSISGGGWWNLEGVGGGDGAGTVAATGSGEPQSSKVSFPFQPRGNTATMELSAGRGVGIGWVVLRWTCTPESAGHP